MAHFDLLRYLHSTKGSYKAASLYVNKIEKLPRGWHTLQEEFRYMEIKYKLAKRSKRIQSAFSAVWNFDVFPENRLTMSQQCKLRSIIIFVQVHVAGLRLVCCGFF